ncbi:PIN domain-containing protein [Nocardioides sp. NBC_00850]|jgi:predicted nucleic acid-binding protein|uniref:PIN domain-containing protein n=2 Tax=Nocardioides TaxID=1839 RepID=UPI0027D11FC8|nr:PIN domain-containing protein [Actinomycetota bacterium]WTA11410.1 PIN domain-containing protein [Nocardioides sp. NBC_00850]
MHRSALARMSTSPDAEKWSRLIELGQVRITTTTLLEIGHLARSEREWSDLVEDVPVIHMPLATLTPRTEARALEIQRIVLRDGRHRAPSVPDLLVAAVAEEADLTVLHADNDVDLITRTTGQPVERLRA